MSNLKPKVIIVKNYPVRKVTAASVSLVLMILVSTALIVPFIAFGEIHISAAIAITVVAEIIVILGALVWTDQFADWKNALYLKNFKWKNILFGATVGLGMLVILQFLSYGLATFMPPVESSDTSSAIGAIEGPAKYLILLVVVPLIVPFVEEVFFRGYVFGFIKDSGILDPKKAMILGIVISTVLFSAAHIQGFSTFSDLFVVVWIACVGFVNAILVLRTNSVYTAAASHMAYNMGTTILMLIAGSVV